MGGWGIEFLLHSRLRRDSFPQKVLKMQNEEEDAEFAEKAQLPRRPLNNV